MHFTAPTHGADRGPSSLRLPSTPTETWRHRFGTGKSWLACALGHKACRDDRSVLYYRVPRLLDALALARGDGRYPRLLKSLARVELLILDDWGLAPRLPRSYRSAARTENERAAAEAVRLEAEAQAAARANAAEERGRAQVAAGLSAEEIRKAEELASWDFIKDRNEVQDLRDHLARFPGGTTERYALAKLDGLVWAATEANP